MNKSFCLSLSTVELQARIEEARLELSKTNLFPGTRKMIKDRLEMLESETVRRYEYAFGKNSIPEEMPGFRKEESDEKKGPVMIACQDCGKMMKRRTWNHKLCFQCAKKRRLLTRREYMRNYLIGKGVIAI